MLFQFLVKFITCTKLYVKGGCVLVNTVKKT